MEETFIIIKPDAVENNVTNEIINMIVKSGLGLKHGQVFKVEQSEQLQSTLEEHYKEHFGRWYYERLIKHMTSGPMFVGVVTGENAILRMRTLIGDAKVSDQNTIRGRYAIVDSPRNAIHGSDKVESAQREIGIWESYMK